jgi:two-component system OmpR family sensor kinase
VKHRAPLSLRNRISLVLVVAVTGVLCGANVIVFALADRFIDRRTEEALDRQAEFIENFLVPFSMGMAEPAAEQRFPTANDPSAARYMAVIDPAGVTRYSLFLVNGEDVETPSLPDPLPTAPRTTSSIETSTDIEGTDVPFRVRATALDNGTVIISGIETTSTRNDLRVLVVTLALTSGAVVIVLALLARRLVGVGLRPLARMEAAAERIADGDLTHRVSPSNTRTEIGRLGASLNRMLVEIEEAFSERQESEHKLRASQATLKRFAADASHELRTPLTSIQGYAQLLRRGRIVGSEDTARAAARIEDEAARLAALVDDLLMLAQLDEKATPVHQVIDLGPLVAQAVDDRRVIEGDRTIGYSGDPGAMVVGDPHQLARVITNLLGNACQHTPPGTPIEVQVRRVEGPLAPSPSGPVPVGAWVEVDVVDHGDGISADARAHLFDRFFRTDASRARATGGAGLGLAIVASVVDAHHGRCTVLDTAGGGATFRVTLPAFVLPAPAAPFTSSDPFDPHPPPPVLPPTGPAPAAASASAHGAPAASGPVPTASSANARAAAAVPAAPPVLAPATSPSPAGPAEPSPRDAFPPPAPKRPFPSTTP